MTLQLEFSDPLAISYSLKEKDRIKILLEDEFFEDELHRENRKSVIVVLNSV